MAATVEALVAADRAVRRLEASASQLSGLEDPLNDEQCLQALVDLGYLEARWLETVPDVDATDSAARQARVAAVLACRRELTAAWTPAGHVAETLSRYPASNGQAKALTTLEREELLSLVAFDGRLRAPRMPGLGECSIWSRVLHFRLSTLNLYSGPVSAPVGQETRRALLELFSILELAPASVETFDSLGDARALCERFVQRYPEDPIVIHAGQQGPVEREYSDLSCDPEGFGSIEERAAKLGLIGQLREQAELRRFMAERVSKEEQLVARQNRLGVVLVQLRLWMVGYYHGRVDGSWGSISWSGLHRALTDALGDDTYYRPTRAVVSVGNGLSAINPRFVLGKLTNVLLAPVEPSSGEIDKVIEIVSEGGLPPADPAGATPAVMAPGSVAPAPVRRRSLWTSISTALKSAARSVYLAGRRIYVGAREVVTQVARSVRRGLEWLAEGLGTVSDALGGVFRLVYTSIERSVRGVGDAFGALAQFLSGAPIVIGGLEGTAFCYSKLCGDADATIVSTPDAPTALHEAHRASRSRQARLLCRAMKIIGVVIHHVATFLTGPLSWVRLGYKVGQQVLRALRESTLAESRGSAWLEGTTET